MHDRIGALDGRVSIVPTPGYATVVSGSVPLHPDRHHSYAPTLGHIPADPPGAA